ncbi:hypothetical protein HanIR_Chr14g0676371 [Helianthus annuus]|nr:hypothetical protein HanIR_Chr14g0676371 [Helianthus annuus]
MYRLNSNHSPLFSRLLNSDHSSPLFSIPTTVDHCSLFSSKLQLFPLFTLLTIVDHYSLFSTQLFTSFQPVHITSFS